MLRRSVSICLCVGALAGEMEDTAAFVQATVHTHNAASTNMAYGRAQLAAALVSAANQSQFPTGVAPGFQGLPPMPKFDCDKYPKLCEAPFNCADWSPYEMMKTPFVGLAPDGKANLRTWCGAPQYEAYIHMCLVQKDLVKAGQIQYDWSVAPGIAQKEQVNELDGSYCFIEGHCSNTAVTNATTLEESYQMCDDRYGSSWRKIASIPTAPKLMYGLSSMPADHSTGFHNTITTQVFLKLACAMGNYHCDVVYCKETYCKNPYYVKKYSHLLPKAPGHLLQFKEWID